MRIISKIARIRNLAVFHDFTWPNELPSFGRYNLIYGWNGTGKTTISRLFRCFESKEPPANGEVTFKINGKDVHNNDFKQSMLSVRVFNRDFISESVFPVGGGEVRPIFVIGKESVEKQREVEQLKKNLEETSDNFATKNIEKRRADDALDKHCVEQARLIKETLRSAGTNPYNNYDKRDYRSNAEEMLSNGEEGDHRLSESDREKYRVQINAKLESKIKEIDYRIPDLTTLFDDVSHLLMINVNSSTIQSLKDEPKLSNWIREGLNLHKSHDTKKCLFCENVLSDERLASLEAHFNVAYNQHIGVLNQRIDEVRDLKNVIDIVTQVFPKRTEFYDDLADDYDAAKKSAEEVLNIIIKSLKLLEQTLISKKERVFESYSLNSVAPVFNSGVIEHLNEIIRKHNEACETFADRATKARRSLEADYVVSYLDEFKKLKTDVFELEESIQKDSKEINRLNENIDELDRTIAQHRQPANELNEDLHKYLGHDELHFDVKDAGYTITRNGLPADKLSEGESTAIALLYFLKSLKDRRFELKNGVVVLDDPVSSLDANAMYLAFGFIREITKDAGQLFILTHNFTFFREIRRWFDHNKSQNQLYMIESAQKEGQRCSSIRQLDNLLEKYNSEYHYLFSKIYRAANENTENTSNSLENNYIFPNMARRLLEAFLAFRQPQDNTLWGKMENSNFDVAKKLRILRFVNTYSHDDVIGEPEHDPSILGETIPILNNLLELIEHEDEKHYNAMVSIIDQTDKKENEA